MTAPFDDDELAAALRALPRDAEAPPRLEERVVSSLQAQGALGRPAWRRWATMAAGVAAGVALFFTGMLVGRSAPSTPPGGRQYVLFLYEDAEFRAEPGLVAEYTAWARGVAKAGHTISGEKLASGARLLGARDTTVVVELRDVATAEGALAGYFVVQAASEEEAVAIARAHPHLRYGGRIVVREIEPT